MCVCVNLRTNTDYFYSNKLSVFITEAESVYSAVRTGYLNQTDTVSSLKGFYWLRQRIFNAFTEILFIRFCLCPISWFKV